MDKRRAVASNKKSPSRPPERRAPDGGERERESPFSRTRLVAVIKSRESEQRSIRSSVGSASETAEDRQDDSSQVDDDVRHEAQLREGRGNVRAAVYARHGRHAVYIEISKPKLRPFRRSPRSTNEDLNSPASTRPVGLRANVKLTDRQDNWCLTREPNRH